MWFASKTLNAPYGKYSYLILKTTFRPNLKNIVVTSSNKNVIKVESISYADRKKENISIKLNAKGDGNTTITVQGYKKTDTASVDVSGQNGLGVGRNNFRELPAGIYKLQAIILVG